MGRLFPMSGAGTPGWAAVGEAIASREMHTPFPMYDAARPMLRIGICSSLSSGFLRELVQQVSSMPSAPELSFQEGTVAQVLQAARRRQVDVGFVYGEQDWAHLEHEPVWRERVLAALPEHHLLAQVTEIPPGRLSRETLLVQGGAEEHDHQAALLRRILGCTPAQVDCLDVDRETLVELAALGFGVALVMGSSLGAFHPAVVYRPVGGDAEICPFHAVWKPGGGNPAFGPFLASVRALAYRWSQKAAASGMGHAS